MNRSLTPSKQMADCHRPKYDDQPHINKFKFNRNHTLNEKRCLSGHVNIE